jgi:predicted N-acetyltransferase YhbS
MADLNPAEGRILEQILDASHEIWHDGLSRERYGRYFEAQRRTAWGRANLSRSALVEGGEVLASAKEYALRGVLDGHPVRILGIGAVFTQPAHRGRGHAGDLLERLIARAADAGAGLALLFSEIGSSYYERFGFTTVPTFDLDLEVARSERHGAPATMVRAGDDRDLDGIVAMNRIRAAPFRFHLERDRDAVAYAITRKRLLAGFGPANAREAQFVVAEEGTTGVAYVVVSVRRAASGPFHGAPAAPDIWTVEECGDRDPAGARVGAILQVLLAREPAERRPIIRASLPPGFSPPQITIIAARPSAEVMMVRPLTPAAEAARTLGTEDAMYWRGDLF